MPRAISHQLSQRVYSAPDQQLRQSCFYQRRVARQKQSASLFCKAVTIRLTAIAAQLVPATQSVRNNQPDKDNLHRIHLSRADNHLAPSPFTVLFRQSRKFTDTAADSYGFNVLYRANYFKIHPALSSAYGRPASSEKYRQDSAHPPASPDAAA
jgi:hypothetical protein